MTIYPDIGEKRPIICTDCGKKPTFIDVDGNIVNRCKGCQMEYVRQAYAATKAMSR
jgi:hypothetical protein